MTALTAPGAARRATRAPRINGRQTFGRALHSEWIKLRSLRSTWVTSAITMSITVLFGAGITIAFGKSSDPELAAEAADGIINGTPFGQIAVAVLAALIITGEYASGQIRSTLTATPHRSQVFAAKALVTAIFTFLLGAVSVLLAWAISAPFIGDHAVPLTDAEYAGYIWGAGLGFAAIALMSLALGFIFRSTAGAISLVVVLLFVITIPFSLLSARFEWAQNVAETLPTNAVIALTDPFSRTASWNGFLEHWQGVLVSCAWFVIPMIIAYAVFSRRDA
ncbi:ABC-2 type transport system permease protein [Actinomyces denticolens]|uniref:ABC-2 type transport system permease protein n=1 Tax=Actinomyces denticolens TaxID=52767 RepID=A0ABY1IKT0_9ACTO|nr:ABC transporter permease subunit [Actinomyces denticolens]SHJ31843.1 ABC-2 type transport system permease protein [Actinomyces denticolens]